MEDKFLRSELEKVFEVKTYFYKENNQRDWLFFGNKPNNGNGKQTVQYKSRLLAALRYEEIGYSVIPMGATIISPDEIKKSALVKWKIFQTMRAKPEQIREWWLRWPEALIGVICGKISGIVAVDTDTPEGEKEFQSLLPEGLEIPTCTTPRGGKHYIFKYQSEIANIDNSHFEVKSDGRIIILPPSKIPDGRGYEWL